MLVTGKGCSAWAAVYKHCPVTPGLNFLQPFGFLFCLVPPHRPHLSTRWEQTARRSASAAGGSAACWCDSHEINAQRCSQGPSACHLPSCQCWCPAARAELLPMPAPNSTCIWSKHPHSKKKYFSSSYLLCYVLPLLLPVQMVNLDLSGLFFSHIKWDIPKREPPSDVWTWTAAVYLYTLWKNKQKSALNQILPDLSD